MNSINSSLEIKILDENSKQSQQSNKVKIQFKPHQLALIQYAKNMEKNKPIKVCDNQEFISRISVLCDKVGSGKSYVMLGLIADNPGLIYPKKIIEYEASPLITKYSINNKYYLPINIIVVPHSILKQWKNYIEDNTELKLYSIYRSSHFITNLMDELKDKDILLISSTQYNKLAEKFKNITISRLIFDEADTIRIPRCKEVKSAHYWFITASYQNLMVPNGHYIRTKAYLDDGRFICGWKRVCGVKHTGFIRDTFVLLTSFKYKKLIFFKNNDEFIDKSFNLPKIIYKTIMCKSPYSLRVLKGLVDNETMNLINAGDIKTAIKRLNCSTTDSESIVEVLCNKLVIELNNAKIEREAKKKYTYTSEITKKNAIQNINKKIKNIETKINNINERIKNNKICPICQDEVKEATYTKCCQNVFCFKCIMTHINFTNKSICPMCRDNNLMADNLVIMDESNKYKDQNKDQKEDELMDKDKTIMKIITEDKKKKFLIFSNYEASFSKLSENLKEYNMKYKKLQGTYSTINKIIDKYNNTDEINILLINSNFFGSGLNLEKTTDIIIYHRVDSNMRNQIIGRAQRLGRKNSLKVWSLSHENELD
jgi:hypothetical protein